jgi:hypothetical protein
MLAASLIPKSAEEIAATIGCDVRWVRVQMAYCLRAGVVGAVEWRQPNPRAHMQPVWRIGSEHTPGPSYKRSMPRLKPSVGVVLLVSILHAARDEQMTVREMSEDLRYCYHMTLKRVSAMHKAGLLHVCGWDRPTGKGRPAARFAFGPGIDVPRSKGQSKAKVRAYHRAYQARRRMAAQLGLRAA